MSTKTIPGNVKCLKQSKTWRVAQQESKHGTPTAAPCSPGFCRGQWKQSSCSICRTFYVFNICYHSPKELYMWTFRSVVQIRHVSMIFCAEPALIYSMIDWKMRTAVDLRPAFDETGIVCCKSPGDSMCEAFLITSKAAVHHNSDRWKKKLGCCVKQNRRWSLETVQRYHDWVQKVHF